MIRPLIFVSVLALSFAAQADVTQNLPIQGPGEFRGVYGGMNAIDGEVITTAALLKQARLSGCSIENLRLSRTYKTDANGKILKSFFGAPNVNYQVDFEIVQAGEVSKIRLSEKDFDGQYFTVFKYKSNSMSANLKVSNDEIKSLFISVGGKSIRCGG